MPTSKNHRDEDQQPGEPGTMASSHSPRLTRTRPRLLRLIHLRAAALLALVLVIASACTVVTNEPEAPPERSRSDLATVQARSPMVRATSEAATATVAADATATASRAAVIDRRRSSTATAAATATPVPARPTRGTTEPTTPNTPADGTPPAIATSAPPPSADQGDPLHAALLQRTDLDGGIWADSPNTAVPYLELCDAMPLDIAFEVAWVSTTAFVSTRGGDLQQWVYYVPGIATEAMDYLHASFGCEQFDYYYYVDNQMLLSQLPMTLPGENPYGRQFELDFDDPLYDSMAGTVVISRSGDFITAILHVEYRAFDPAETAGYLERALSLLYAMPPTVLPEPTVPIF